MKKSNRVANKVATAIKRMMSVVDDCVLCLDKKATMTLRQGGELCRDSFLYLVHDERNRVCVSGRGFEATPLSELDVQSLRVLKNLAEYEQEHFDYWK